MTDTTPRWANRQAAREYAGVSDATFYRYVNAGVFVRHDIGKGLYDLDQIDDAIRRHATPATAVHTAIEARRSGILDALNGVRARIPKARPLVAVTAVHAALDEVAAALGANQ